MKKCPVKQCLIGTLAVFVWMAAFEMLYHHSAFLMNLYHETPSVWRPMDEMRALMPLMWVRLLALAVVISCLYKRKIAAPSGMSCGAGQPEGEKKKGCPYLKGVCFGLKIGLLLGITQASFFVYLPISGTLALAWFFGALIEGLGIGLILAIVCKKKDCSPT